MTLHRSTAPASPAAPAASQILDRILAAYRLVPVERRSAARELLAELLSVGYPTLSTIRAWGQIGFLLRRCAIGASDDDTAVFLRLAQLSDETWEAAREEVYAVPPQRVPTQPVQRVRVHGLVIDVKWQEVA